MQCVDQRLSSVAVEVWLLTVQYDLPPLAVVVWLLTVQYVVQSLPPLAVECAELDGEPGTTPVIYEDQYQHVSEFVRRRRQAGCNTHGEADHLPFIPH